MNANGDAYARHEPTDGWCVRASSSRPLYLAGSLKARIDAEAESLVVRREPTGSQRFPVARLDRIICGRGVRWSGDALVLVLARGITITWIDGAGRAVGEAVPRWVLPSTLDAVLDRCLEQPRWEVSYEHWLSRRRLAILAGWRRQRSVHGAPPTAGEWEATKRALVCHGRVDATYPIEAFAWCRSIAAGALTAAGLRVRYRGYAGRMLELAEDMAGLLWAEVNLHHRVMATALMTWRAAATAFEARRAASTDSMREHLVQLDLHMNRSLDTWP